MRISEELIKRCSSKHLLSPNSSEDPLERITHLYLQEQHIRRIENLESCKNLIALYLYDNKIERIENLDLLTQLNYLYLHKNDIRRIENLDLLSQLTILNLSHNSICKLEGLETLCDLRELYIQHQNLPDEQSLEFDKDTITWLSKSLRVLNVSGNRVPSFFPLAGLECLESFSGEENAVSDLQDLVDAVSGWSLLKVMKLAGNPVCAVRKYRDNMVVNCLELVELDGKVITQQYRNFLLNWKQCQTLQDLKRESYAVLKPFLEAREFIAKEFSTFGPLSLLSITTRFFTYCFDASVDAILPFIDTIERGRSCPQGSNESVSCSQIYLPPSNPDGCPDMNPVGKYWICPIPDNAYDDLVRNSTIRTIDNETNIKEEQLNSSLNTSLPNDDQNQKTKRKITRKVSLKKDNIRPCPYNLRNRKNVITAE